MKKSIINHPPLQQSSDVSKVLKNIKIILCTALIICSFSSCSGDGGDSIAADYYFRANIDGSEVNFHNVNFQGGGNDGRWEHIVVGGYESAFPTNGGQIPPSLDFEIWKLGGSIASGTYATAAVQEMTARYAVQTDNGTLLYNTSYHDDLFTVKIESISTNGIKGTFEGTVRNQAGAAKVIANGSFNLPYKDLVNP